MWSKFERTPQRLALEAAGFSVEAVDTTHDPRFEEGKGSDRRME